jgi:hypothetical protein
MVYSDLLRAGLSGFESHHGLEFIVFSENHASCGVQYAGVPTPGGRAAGR